MKQLNMFDMPPYCQHKADYDIMDTMTPLERSAFLLGSVKVIDDIEEPQPIKQINPIIGIGMYVRTVDNRIFKISDIGKPGVCFDKLKHHKNKDGTVSTRKVSKTFETFYVADKINDKKVYIPFSEFDVIESHDTLIECLYAGDRVIDQSRNSLYVFRRINSKKKGIFILCKNNKNETLLLRNEDIVRPVNKQWLDPKLLKKGDKVKHRTMGWLTIEKIWGYKIQAQEKDKNGIYRWFKIWDVIEVEEIDEFF